MFTFRELHSPAAQPAPSPEPLVQSHNQFIQDQPGGWTQLPRSSQVLLRISE